jgi:general secretion pathway protein A
LGLVTGSSGVGKSALLNRVWHAAARPWRSGLLPAFGTTLQWAICCGCWFAPWGRAPLWSKDQLLCQIRQRAQQADGTLLVLLDEAHLLQATALTDLRLLVSSALDDQPPLKLVLAGQPPLLELLRRHRDVLDRISVRYHLHPLSKPQTAAYLDFHLQTAGGTEAIFEPPVKDLIHDYTGGVPRQINNLATACLLQAAVRNAARVDEPLLQQTLSEFHLP